MAPLRVAGLWDRCRDQAAFVACGSPALLLAAEASEQFGPLRARRRQVAAARARSRGSPRGNAASSTATAWLSRSAWRALRRPALRIRRSAAAQCGVPRYSRRRPAACRAGPSASRGRGRPASSTAQRFFADLAGGRIRSRQQRRREMEIQLVIAFELARRCFSPERRIRMQPRRPRTRPCRRAR